MKRTPQTHRHDSAARAPKQAATKPDSPSAPNGRFKGMIDWFEIGRGWGEIDPTGFDQPPIPLRSGRGLPFDSTDLCQFDPHRLNVTDVVEFSLEQTAEGLRAVKVEVVESVAENCEGDDTKPRTFTVKLEAGTAISGFTMAYADWARLESAAVDWADATGDSRPCLAGFIEEAIKAKVAAVAARAACPARAIADGPPSGAEIISPTRTAVRLIDAIGQLRHKVNEAGALALLNADSMAQGIMDKAGWDHFDLNGASDGLQGLAHAVLNRLRGGLGVFERMYQPSTERLRTITAPVAAVNVSPDVRRELLSGCGCVEDDSVYALLEKEVYAMRAVLELQSSALNERGSEHVFALVEYAAEELDAAHSNFWSATCNFNHALVAVEMAQRVAAERRAA